MPPKTAKAQAWSLCVLQTLLVIHAESWPNEAGIFANVGRPLMPAALLPGRPGLATMRLVVVARAAIDAQEVRDHLLQVQFTPAGQNADMSQMLAMVTHLAEGYQASQRLYVVRIIVAPDFMAVQRRMAGMADAAAIAIVLIS